MRDANWEIDGRISEKGGNHRHSYETVFLPVRIEPVFAAPSSQPLNFRFPFFCIDAEIFHAAVKMAAVDAHRVCRARNVAVEFGEFMKNEFALVSVGRILERRKAKRRRGRFVRGVE